MSRAIQLSQREYDVLQKLSEGLKSEEVGDALGIGLETVKTHLKRIVRRYELNDITEAIFTCCRTHRISGPPTGNRSLNSLSKREFEVAYLICMGFENEKIKEVLFLSLETVRRHVSRILAKWELRNRAHIAGVMGVLLR